LRLTEGLMTSVLTLMGLTLSAPDHSTVSRRAVTLPVKKPAVRQAIEATGATLLFLPAYSPDLDPVDQVFAELKAPLRKMALRSVEALWKALGSITECVFPSNAKTSSKPPSHRARGTFVHEGIQKESRTGTRLRL
jgi:transposase